MALKEPHTITDALEALDTLAELDQWGEDLELMLVEPQMLEQSDVRQWTVRWVQEHGAEQTVLLVRRLFRLVLHHLRHAAAQQASPKELQSTLRGMVSVMASVGEAAQKLDHLTAIFYGAQQDFITQTEEYRQLQSFYHTAIETPEALELAPSQEAVDAPNSEQMTELERVIADLDYELFSLRKDDGTPFLTTPLKESTELACDFGIDLESFEGDDPLVWVLSWKDQLLHNKARLILGAIWEDASIFYQLRRKAKRGDLADALSYAMMALMLAAKPSNLLVEFAKKPSYRYFHDFQAHLRRAMRTREYQKLISYPSDDEWDRAQRALVHGFCCQLICEPWEESEASATVERLIHNQGLPAAGTSVSEGMRADYEALATALQKHPSGPLFKMLDLVREAKVPPFDPWLEGNIPGCLAQVALDGTECRLLRLPAPIRQSVLSKPVLDEEFRGFLRCRMLRGKRKGQLLINLQSRTSWQEHSRATLLEQLEENEETAHYLTVVTLATDSPFYQQTGPFDEELPPDLFFDRVVSEVADPSGSYFFPDYVRQALIPAFVRPILEAICHTYFPGAQALSRSQRQRIIDLFHFFLGVKLLDLYHPERFAYICKDGVDRSPCAAVGLLAGLEIIRGQEVSKETYRALLHAPALLVRERAMQPHVHERMVRMIETLEKTTFDPTLFEDLYHASWWIAD